MSRVTASRPTTANTTAKRPSTSHSRGGGTRPGTATKATTDPAPSQWLVAILEGKGREVGVVAIESDTHQVIVTQYADTPTFVKTMHLLTSRSPHLILVPVTALGNARDGEHLIEGQLKGEPTLLVKCLRDGWRSTSIVGVARKYWVEQAGFEFIQQLIVEDEERTGTIMSIKSKYYALSAIAALFKYLEMSLAQHFPPRSLRIRFAPLDGTMLIDADTSANLELVANLIHHNSKQHLLGLLNHCYTPMGTRLLRANILSPLTDTSVIDTRLEVVEEFVGSEERFHAIRKALEPLRSLDVDKLIGHIATPQRRNPLSKSTSDPAKASEAKIARLLQLRLLLHSLAAIKSALHNSSSALLKMIENILSDERTDGMLEQIADTINEDAVTSLQKGALQARNTKLYAIKAERKLLLDVARETYKENTADAHELADDLKLKFDLDVSLYFAQTGFVFVCLQADLDEKKGKSLPFINVVKRGKKVHFSTMDLSKKNARILESVQEIFLMSDDILNEVFEKIQGGIAALYRCAEAIAMLDMLASFADVASKLNYVRPEWTGTLAIKAGRHPLHECFRLNDGAFIPNDVYASDLATFQLIFGVNMSGKSTLLKQIALLYIMAQIGCYVPAEYASFRVIDALLSRMSNDDSIETSLSTFAKEMSTMAMIMSSMKMIKESGRECLVIIDELGRGTSPSEGIGIAHALAEEIIKANAICFFATHFKDLAVTLGNYPNVVSLHLETEIDPTQADFSLTFHHRVVDGISPHTHYGLELAKVAKLPTDVLEIATEVSGKLEALARAGQQASYGNRVAHRRRELLKLTTFLKDLSQAKSITAPELARLLKQLQDDTVDILAQTFLPAPMQVESDVQSDAEASPVTQPMDRSEEDQTSSPTPLRSHSHSHFEACTLDDYEDEQDCVPIIHSRNQHTYNDGVFEEDSMIVDEIDELLDREESM